MKIHKKNKNILSINPLDIYIKNSGPDYFIFPKELITLNIILIKKENNILFLQGAKDSNNQLNKLINYVLRNNKKINFRFKIIVKNSMVVIYSKILILNFYKNPCTIYKNIQIAISSVGNSSFELGRIGVQLSIIQLKEERLKGQKILKIKYGFLLIITLKDN